jgi:hypothetical protein
MKEWALGLPAIGPSILKPSCKFTHPNTIPVEVSLTSEFLWQKMNYNF